MATEELIVLLDAQTQKLDAKLKATEKRLDDFEGKTGKADKSLMSMSATAKSVGAGLLKVAAVVVAVNAAVTAMVLSSAKSRRELELLSAQAKTSASDFQALAFATGNYGINAGQIADISKDVSDKVGEFSAAGTGAFQDYADVMKLTKEEARQVATEFQSLSSQEVIGKMVSEMESVNTTGDQMTFVLESMGNDLSRLKPLFAGNSEELNKLKDRFKSVNSQLQITEGQAQQLKDVSNSYSLLTQQIGNATTEISASLAPAMDEFFNDVISVVPQATQVLINFINTFRSPEEIKSLEDINALIEMSKEKLERLSPVADRVGKLRADNAATLNILSTTGERVAEKQFEAELKNFNLLEKQKLVLEETIELKRIADAETPEGGKISVTTTSSGTGDEIQAIADRFKTEEELLADKLTRELEIIGEDKILRHALEEKYWMDIVELEQKGEDEKNKIAQDSAKSKISIDQKRQNTEQSLEKKNVQSLMSISSSILGQSEGIGKALFLGSQALALSETFVNTQAASIKALTIDPTGILSAKVQASGNISMAAIAATTLGSLSSSGGGGSTGGSGSFSSSGGEAITPRNEQGNFQEETSSLSLTDSSASGSQAINITVPDGDEIGQAIANWLSKATAEGRV